MVNRWQEYRGGRGDKWNVLAVLDLVERDILIQRAGADKVIVIPSR
jgi:hypothetical protein